MGRRLNISQPTVIDTELVPLDEMFAIEADGQTEQWYYDNTSQYAPNRKVTPLTLTPKISVHDSESGMSYTPTIHLSRWFALEWNATTGDYVETEIVNQTDSATADYVKMPNDTLKVKKNVGYEHGVTIRCEVTYIDPRDAGITYAVQDTLLLTTNHDADVVIPEVAITSPSARSFNPLVDYDSNDNQLSQFEFKGTITNGVKPEVVNDAIGAYKVDGYGTEEVLPTPTDEGVVTSCSPTIDIRYSGAETRTGQRFAFRRTADGELLTAEGKAMILAMRGETVKWNQIANTIALYEASKWSSTRLSDGSYTITATADNTRISFYIKGTSTIIGGHKYFLQTIKGVTMSVKNEQADESVYLENGQGIVQFSSNVSIFGSSLRAFETSYTRMIGDAFHVQQCIIDLTDIFGAGHEPSTIADFESWLATNIGVNGYYAYSGGELIPVKTTGFRTTGFNQWDEEWELGGYSTTDGSTIVYNDRIRTKNPIEVSPSTQYFAKYGYVRSLWYYDADDNFISFEILGNTSTFTTPSKCRKFRFVLETSYGTTYNHDICINFSGSKNGTYEPYWNLTSCLNVTAIKGKLNGLGDSVTVFPDGMKRVDDVYDEIYMEGGTLKAKKRVKRINLGDLNWEINFAQASLYCFVSDEISDLVYNTDPTTAPTSIICSRYENKDFSGVVVNNYDKAIATRNNVGKLDINDRSYTDKDVFKAAMNGVYLYYVTTTEETYILDPIQELGLVWYGVKDGVEVRAEELPYYVSGQETDTLTVDAMYGEEINIVLRAYMDTTQSELSPSKAFASLTWRIPDVDTHVISENGSAVRSNTEDMRFSTSINVNGGVLSDERKRKHIAQNWKYRADSETSEHDAGWGDETLIEASKLRNSRVVIQGQSTRLASTLVFPYVYVKGAYEPLTLDNDTTPVTDSNGNPIYGRTVL